MLAHPFTVGSLALAASAGAWWTAHMGVPVIGLVAALVVPAFVGRWSGPARALAAAGAEAVAIALVAAAGVSSLGAAELAAVYAALVAGALWSSRWGATVTAASGREKALSASRADLVRNVSHELRTPLTVIQGLLTTLFQHWDTLDEPAKLDLIDSASSNVASLDASVLHFIDAGRLERGEVEVAMDDVDLAPLLEEVEHKLRMVLAGYDVRASFDVESWRTDRAAAGRILELFLENAARFSPVGSVITVSARRQPEGLELAVSDKGQGVPPTARDKVFEPFWRSEVSETGVSRGAGLGLYVAKRLAEHLGGHVGFSSVKGRGSRFYAVLPPG